MRRRRQACFLRARPRLALVGRSDVSAAWLVDMLSHICCPACSCNFLDYVCYDNAWTLVIPNVLAVQEAPCNEIVTLAVSCMQVSEAMVCRVGPGLGDQAGRRKGITIRFGSCLLSVQQETQCLCALMSPMGATAAELLLQRQKHETWMFGKSKVG